MANYTKLISAGLAVATIGSYVFNFNGYGSQDSLIKQGIDKIKAVALRYKADLAELQEDYDNLLKDVQASENALEQARLQLKAIYEKLTGNVWDDANGDIINHDFDQYLKDQEQFENNVDGNAIAQILNLPAGASTQEIIEAIQDLLDTIRDLEVRVEQLEAQVASLEAEIQTYKDEQDDLVEEINGLKTKLDNATAEANAIIDNATAEEQAQLDYIDNVLEELGEEPIQQPEPEEQEPEVEKVLTYNYIGDWANTPHKEQFDQAMAQAVGDFKDEVNLKLYADNDVMIAAYTDNQEYFNQITSHPQWNNLANGECFYIDNDGNIVDKATGEANNYYKVRIMYQANL